MFVIEGGVYSRPECESGSSDKINTAYELIHLVIRYIMADELLQGGQRIFKLLEEVHQDLSILRARICGVYLWESVTRWCAAIAFCDALQERDVNL
jgi:hypothetical protein